MGFLMIKSSPILHRPSSRRLGEDGSACAKKQLPTRTATASLPAKINATALYPISRAFYLYPNAVPDPLAHHTIPIVETARRLPGLVQPVLSPPGGSLADLLRLDRFQALGIKRYTLGRVM